jgi:hypothetical protein
MGFGFAGSFEEFKKMMETGGLQIVGGHMHAPNCGCKNVENLVVRKLTEAEIVAGKRIRNEQAELKRQQHRIELGLKKVDVEHDLFWQDVIEASEGTTPTDVLHVDLEAGFLYKREVLESDDDNNK